MREKPKVPPGMRDYFAALGRMGGRKGGALGGAARAKKLSVRQRHDIAVKAAKTRWAKKKPKGGGR